LTKKYRKLKKGLNLASEAIYNALPAELINIGEVCTSYNILPTELLKSEHAVIRCIE
jgi:hypothetical protein